MAAGGSASRRAQEARRQERLLREQWQVARQEARRWEAASEGERLVAAQLLVLTERGWRLLVDRRWPGTRTANVDMLLAGPGGVFVLDVKNWRAAPQITDGRLHAEGQDRDAHVRKLLAMTRTAEHALSALGLSPVAVRPLMVFAGQHVDATLGRVRLLGEREVGPVLLGEPIRLRPEGVRALADHLERAFPDYESSSVPKSTEQPPQLTANEGLFDIDGLRDAALAEAMKAPVEQWMTFLAPDQIPLVRRNWSGPARISGPAGTGKTVVGLHRAAHLAQRTGGRVLYVTFANNLPRVQGTFLKTMSSAVADRVDFRSLHQWAQEFLRARGIDTRLHKEKSDTAFGLAWKDVGRAGPLAEFDSDPTYWQEEIAHVIKGRGITAFEEYATLRRAGRRTALRRVHREAMWALYEEYEKRRTEKGVHDFDDVLSLALAELTRTGADGTGTSQGRGPNSPYTSVIVDEVQDLSLVGVRLLHALVGDTPNGLLLIGDGQQAVYPGGFRLGDAGIDIRGDRGQVLRTNYRNAEEILEAALAVVRDDPFEDIDGVRTPGRRDVDLTYHDGKVLRSAHPTLAGHDQALLAALHALPPDRLGDAAVLCPSKRAITQYHRLLTRSGLPVCLLEHYDGHPTPGIKLGTYRRAKGLEFKHVYLPQHDAHLTTPTTSRETTPERRQLARSQLFVAMTRARDLLWLGTVTPHLNLAAE
ncbi:nuclease-related domain-containing DEAD/DEAH box helicase [Streptomyces acidiscabies]|uniref:DNA 3'-5' helicase n=1 Tax=Streptomyces acidiscabies TaxID=42234 RepID=A0A0L0K8Q8_9ACTN|nr:UvrD-helicase domain-containing protein [Streptomyces acidiscabies]KND34025.1 NERD nuclease [Streptomyces acidiscabies]